MSELHVGVGSLNQVKIDATQRAFTDTFPKSTVVIHAYETESGVSAQPLSTEESFEGAKNRAKAVIEFAKQMDMQLTFAVGLEGGIDRVYGRDMYVIEGCAWVIDLGSLALGFGVSAGVSVGVPAPAALSNRLVVDGEEMGPVMAEVFDDETLRSGIGANGLLTSGAYVREQEFYDAIRAALAPIYNRDLYFSPNFNKEPVRYTE